MRVFIWQSDAPGRVMLAQPSLVEPPEIQSNVGSGLAVNSTSATSAVPARITDVPPLKLGGSAAYKPTSVDISPAGVSPAAAVPAVTAGSEVSPLVSPPATSKIKGANSRVEKSQGSLGVINSMLHSFTAGKAAKSVTAKKGSTLTDAQASQSARRQNEQLVHSLIFERYMLLQCASSLVMLYLQGAVKPDSPAKSLPAKSARQCVLLMCIS